VLANMSRTPAILADAALYIFSKPSAECTGNWFIDEEVLAAEVLLIQYSVVPERNCTDLCGLNNFKDIKKISFKIVSTLPI
jgi:hypothetical protein